MRIAKFGITEDQAGEKSRCFIHGFLAHAEGGLIVCEMVGTGKIIFKKEGDVRFETDDEASARHAAAVAARKNQIQEKKDGVNFVPEF